MVELDGGVHDTTLEEDARRNSAIGDAGFAVIRFRNEELFRDPDSCCDRIAAAYYERS